VNADTNGLTLQITSDALFTPVLLYIVLLSVADLFWLLAHIIWNSLPHDVTSLQLFCSWLKTHLFIKSFPDVCRC